MTPKDERIQQLERELLAAKAEIARLRKLASPVSENSREEDFYRRMERAGYR